MTNKCASQKETVSYTYQGRFQVYMKKAEEDRVAYRKVMEQYKKTDTYKQFQRKLQNAPKSEHLLIENSSTVHGFLLFLRKRLQIIIINYH